LLNHEYPPDFFIVRSVQVSFLMKSTESYIYLSFSRYGFAITWD